MKVEAPQSKFQELMAMSVLRLWLRRWAGSRTHWSKLSRNCRCWRRHRGIWIASPKIPTVSIVSHVVIAEDRSTAARRAAVSLDGDGAAAGARVAVNQDTVSSFAQAERCAGLQVGGFPAGKHPKLCGVFRRVAAAPDANDRPHYSTAEGGHLYYSIQDKWLLNATGFTPNKTNATVTFATAGEVPVGEAVWRYVDMSLKDTDGTMGKFVDRMLTVTEL